jgi:S-DNA-T family DNA segregation ATPase FtsK/SpoIIIE
MTIRRTTSAKGKAAKPPLLPPAVTLFLQRRAWEYLGLAISVTGLAMLAAIISYHSGDPSLNTGASEEDIKNWLGLHGAYTADILLQSLGFASLILPITIGLWGTQITRYKTWTVYWGQFVLLLVSALLLSCAFAAIPLPWTMAPHWGGSLGALLLKISMILKPLTGGLWAKIIVALICGVLGVWAAFRAMGYSRAAWLYGLSALRDFGSWLREGWHFIPQTHPDDDVEVAREEIVRNQDKLRTRTRDIPSRAPVQRAVSLPAPPVKQTKKVTRERVPSLLKNQDDPFELPSLNLLKAANAKRQSISDGALRKNADVLQNVLEDFGIRGDITQVNPGPVVTQYELEPAPGLKSSRVINLSDDIARSMHAISARVAVIPGRNVIGIELPNKEREMVALREMLSSDVFADSTGHLNMVLGKDISGQPIIADLARMPHLLVAGTTGSGKSVGVNAMILSLLYRLTPAQCRLILIDPKMLELSVYQDIPHLLTPVVTEPTKAIVALKWAVREMEDRYRAMSKLGVRNIDGYNARIRESLKRGEKLSRRVQTGFDPDTGKPVFEDQDMAMEELPFIVVVVDEFADLMLVAGKDVEAAIQRLAQMARAAGIHLIMATQRPSVDVITGTIKANFPSRISFQVTSRIDSRTILGESGAENLLGKGDMLYMAGGGRITRVHGPFVSDEEVEKVVKHLKSQGEPVYIDDVTHDPEEEMGGLFGEGSGGDDLYQKAIDVVMNEGKASTSFIQRHLRIGYNRAATIIEQMEKDGVISPANHVGKREVLIGNGRR